MKAYPNAVAPWLTIGRRLVDAGVPFLPFVIGGQGVASGRDGLPFYLFPEHRNLPHWTAANDPAPTVPV